MGGGRVGGGGELICVVTFQYCIFLWKSSNKAYFCGNFATKDIFFGNFPPEPFFDHFPTKRNFGEITKKKKKLWKIINKSNCCGNFCGKFQARQFFCEIFFPN